MDIELRGVEVASLFKLNHLFVPAHEKVLIFGPSGTGKTSLLHLIGGLWRPLHGEILFNGINLCGMRDNELSHFRRRQVGLIFQRMNLIEHMTCEENLSLVSTQRNGEYEEVLSKVGLLGKLKVKAGSLSLGEQQRLAVVRVLLQNPQVILADEPTSSLDEVNAFNVMQLLLEASQKKTLIMVSHDLRLQNHFDRCLDFGKMIA